MLRIRAINSSEKKNADGNLQNGHLTWLVRCMCCFVPFWINIWEKLRRLLPPKRQNRTLQQQWLFHVGHVDQNRRSAISLAWQKWFSCKGREWKIYCCWQRQGNEPKCVLHVQNDCFSSFNQSHHCFCLRRSNLLISALQRDDASRDWTFYSAWCLCGIDSLPASQPIASKYLSMCYGQASHGWVPRVRETSNLSLNCQ